jgi:hypothetical protein
MFYFKCSAMHKFLFFTGFMPLFLLLANTRTQNKNYISVPPEVSISDTRIIEGDTGRKIVEVMVTLSQPAPALVTVSFSTRNGTATVAGPDYIAAEGSVTFNRNEVVKWISILIIGERVCEEDEKFEIILSNPSGAALGDESGTITIINDDCNLSNLNLPSGAGRGLSIYEVRLTHTGFTTFLTGPPECPIRPDGRVTLTGLLYGAENVPADDDIVYTGTLQLDMDMDICSVDGADDQNNLCGMRAVGSGPVYTTLEIYFDNRGGYIKIENKSASFLRSLTGTCGQLQKDEERTMIPNKTIATIFNGRDLPMLTSRTLTVGRFVEDDGEGNVTVVEVLRVIRRP